MLVGHLGTEPQKLPVEDVDGCRFKLATNESYPSSKDSNDDGSKKYITRTEWHNIKLFGQNARFALESVKQGDYVLVLGYLHYHTPKDLEENATIKVRNSEIIARQFLLLNRPNRATLEKISSKVFENFVELQEIMMDPSINEETRKIRAIELLKI